MKNRIAKQIIFLLAAVILISAMPQSTYAENAIIKTTVWAKVLQVVDGDAIKVQLLSTNEIAWVRLAGVDAMGNDGALGYMNNELLGRVVEIRPDHALPTPVNQWNFAYVYCNGAFINRILLEKGYAKVPDNYSASSSYNTFLSDQQSSQSLKIGIWAVDQKYSTYASYYYSGNGVNINTCTEYQLMEHLDGIDSSLASRIVSYRQHNPFQTVADVKFVGGFSRDLFDENASQMTVFTNINRATEKELLTLKNMTQSDVDRIINFRLRQSFTSVYQLYSEGLLSISKYDANEPYIDVTDKQGIDYAIPDIRVNINTAGHRQLVSAGLSSSVANYIIDNRDHYSFKYIGELIDRISVTEINRIADNICTITDINHASLDEIRSLFGDNYSSAADTLYNHKPYGSVTDVKSRLSESDFATIEPHIYVGAYVGNRGYTNINTASLAQLRALGLSESQVDSVYSRRRNMTGGARIPVDLSAFNSKIALYTNINTAPLEELNTLLQTGNSTHGYIAGDLLSYRNSQPFGTMDEVREFFDEKGLYSLYADIRSFIVLR